MRKPAIASLAYARLFPSPKSTDPTSFQAHVTRNIIPEVRAETACYYGPTDCLEAQYPGLDYASAAHRGRLVRFTWHRRLFRAFDELRLTAEDIRDLCRWEGTRFARERYEEEHNCSIRDTTWDGMDVMELRQASSTGTRLPGGEIITSSAEGVQEPQDRAEHMNVEEDLAVQEDGLEEEDSEDELQHSVGIDLNRHLMVATEARARGEEVVLDADWEQWMKEAAERGASEGTLAGVGSSRGRPTGSQTYGQQIPPVFQSNPAQQIEVLNASQYVAYSATTTSSAQPTGTAM